MNWTRAAATLLSAAGLAMGGLGLVLLGSGVPRIAALGTDYVPAPQSSLSVIFVGLGATAWILLKTHRSRLFAQGSVVLALVLLGSGLVAPGRLSPLSAACTVLSAVALVARARSARRAFWIVSTSGGASLILSSLALLMYAAGSPLPAGTAQSAAPMGVLAALGWLFVDLALLLHPTLDEAVPRLIGPSDDVDPASVRDTQRWLAIVAGLVALVTFLSLLALLRSNRRAALESAEDVLGAVSRIKARQVSDWREERASEGRYLMSSRPVVEDLVALAATPGDDAVRARVGSWLEALRSGARYERVGLYDSRGTLVFATPQGPEPDDPDVAREVRLGAARRELAMTEWRGGEDGRARLLLWAPVRSSRTPPTQTADAVAVLQVDPRLSLSPLIREWPGPTESGDAVLLARSGDEIRPVSESRRGGDPVRRLGAVAPDEANALGGDGLLHSKVDARGVPVLYMVRPVPGSEWLIEVRIDQREALAGERREAALLVALALAFGTISSLLGVLALRRRESGLLRQAQSADRARRDATTRLSFLLSRIGDVVFLVDRERRIIEANDRVIDVYGLTPEAMRGMVLDDFRTPAEREKAMADCHSLVVGDTMTVLTRHQRSDGREFPVELSARLVELEGKPFMLVVARDGAEREASEQERRAHESAILSALREKESLLKEVHHRVKNNLQVILSLLRLEKGRASDPSARFVLGEMQGRIFSMALLHETLYRSGGFARVELGAYLRALGSQVFRTQALEGHHVDLELDLGEATLELEHSVPCGLLVNELLTNALKHAFPDGRRGRVILRLREFQGVFELEVKDDGVGMPAAETGQDVHTLGLQLVGDLARQIGGRVEVESNGGTTVRVRFVPPGSRPSAAAPPASS